MKCQNSPSFMCGLRARNHHSQLLLVFEVEDFGQIDSACAWTNIDDS